MRSGVVFMAAVAALVASLACVGTALAQPPDDTPAPAPALPGPPPAPGAGTREHLREAARHYREARGRGLNVPAALVAQRLAGKQPTLLIDLRAKEVAARAAIPGASVVSLADLFGEAAPKPPDGGLVVVLDDGGGRDAAEALLLLRLSGVNAVSVKGGAPALHAELARRGLVAAGPTLPAARPEMDGASRPASAPPPQDQRSLLPGWAWGLIAVLLLAVAAALGYFLVVRPWRLRRPLLEALGILQRDEQARFPEAARLLQAALTAGLAPADIEDARFALAYARAREGRLPEAAAALEELESKGREALYLGLWLKVRQRQWEEAERHYETHAKELADYLETRCLAGLALLELGRKLLSQDPKRSLGFFERLRKLGVYQDLIPPGIEDRRVTMGIEAMINSQFEDAREHFKEALESSTRDKRPTLYAELGLLLAEWRASERPDVDERLEKLVVRADKELPPEPAGQGSATGDKLSERRRLLRDLALWHAMSLLFTWLRLPVRKKRGSSPRAALPATQREVLKRRLARVTELDPKLADPRLIAGLIDYYFAGDSDERRRAAESLDKVTRSEVHLPEVHLIVEREKRLEEAEQQSLETYLVLVRDYLADRGVPLGLRQQLHERLQNFSRFRKQVEGVTLEPADAEAAPTVSDLSGRSELTQHRVETIVRSKLANRPEARESIKGLLEQLRSVSQTLGTTAEGLEKTEQELMLVTGEFLLAEEEPSGGGE